MIRLILLFCVSSALFFLLFKVYYFGFLLRNLFEDDLCVRETLVCGPIFQLKSSVQSNYGSIQW